MVSTLTDQIVCRAHTYTHSSVGRLDSRYARTHAPTHARTHACSHSTALTRIVTHSLTNSFAHSLTHSPAKSPAFADTARPAPSYARRRREEVPLRTGMTPSDLSCHAVPSHAAHVSLFVVCRRQCFTFGMWHAQRMPIPRTQRAHGRIHTRINAHEVRTHMHAHAPIRSTSIGVAPSCTTAGDVGDSL